MSCGLVLDIIVCISLLRVYQVTLEPAVVEDRRSDGGTYELCTWSGIDAKDSAVIMAGIRHDRLA